MLQQYLANVNVDNGKY